MRGTFVKVSRGLLTLTVIGITSIFLGFLYFLGVASSNRLFIGFDYQTLIAFGIYLTLITILPVLAGMDARTKANVKKLYPHLIILVCVSLIGLLYSFLVYGIYLNPFDVQHSWIDYFTLFGTILILGILPFLFAVKDRDSLWNFKYIYFGLILIGILIEIMAVLVYGHYLDTLIQLPDIGWDAYFLAGGLLILLGFTPLTIGANSNFRNFLHIIKIALTLHNEIQICNIDFMKIKFVFKGFCDN